jgi:hypothetical protein
MNIFMKIIRDLKVLVTVIFLFGFAIGVISSCGSDNSSTTKVCSAAYPLCCGQAGCCPSGYGYASLTQGKCYSSYTDCLNAGNCFTCKVSTGSNYECPSGY